MASIPPPAYWRLHWEFLVSHPYCCRLAVAPAATLLQNTGPKGREDEAWYGAMHEQVMKKSDFVAEAAKSSTGTSGAAGVWNGVPIVVTYVDHSKNAGSPLSNGKARFQFMEGYDGTGKYVGHFDDLADADPRLSPSEDLVMIFARCTHLCCIPGWQLVSNETY